MSKLVISICLLLSAVYASLAIKCFVTPQPQAQQLLPAAGAMMSGMPDHYLDNFTKMRNSTSRNNNNNSGNDQDADFALYCWTMKCNGTTRKTGLAFPPKIGTDKMCKAFEDDCTYETDDPNPYCKLCNTDDCNNEEEKEERPAGKGALNSAKKSETLKCFFLMAPSQQHLTAAAVVKSGMRTHRYLNNFTKMRNSTSRSNNGDGGDEDDQAFALYCLTMKCNGSTMKSGVAFPPDGADVECTKINQICTKQTGDPNPYCKVCNTDDCNNEEEEQ